MGIFLECASRWASHKAAASAACIALILISGCSDGERGQFPESEPLKPPTRTISGTVQKGAFSELIVTGFPVDSETGELGDPITGSIDDQGYSLVIPDGEIAYIEATGTFTSEYDGEQVELDEPLSVLVAEGDDDIQQNINIATTLVAELALADLQSGTAVDDALDAQTGFINSVLGFDPATDPASLDVTDIDTTSTIDDPNLQLLLLSGGLLQILEGDQFFAGSFGEIVDGITEAETVAEAQQALAILNGLSASLIYTNALTYSGYSLPDITLSPNPVLVCVQSGSCNWTQSSGPGVFVNGLSVYEADGETEIVVRLTEAPTETVVVNIRTLADTASLGDDFIPAADSIEFAPGQVFISIPLILVVDGEAEGNEDLLVSIESESASFPALQTESRITIRDGVPPGLATQEPVDVRIASFDAGSLCNPTISNFIERCIPFDQATDGLGLVANRSSVAATELDLAAVCTDPLSCPARDVDWLAGFYLVARDGAVIVDETPLGTYRYRRTSVQLDTDAADPRFPYLNVATDAARLVAGNALAQGLDLEIEVRLGSDPVLSDSSAVPNLVPVPDTLLVGDTSLFIAAVSEVSDGASAGCAVGQFSITADFSQSAGGIPIATGPVCVDFPAAGPGAGAATMVEGQLDAYGGTAAPDSTIPFVLPDGLYARTGISVLGTEPRVGTSNLLFLLAPDPQLSIVNELHHEGWPFLFVIDRLSLTPNGIELGYSDMNYVMDVDFSASDPRAGAEVFSNDIYYRGVSGQSGALTLTSTGVNGVVNVSGSSDSTAFTAFPKAVANWRGFSQQIDDNELQPTAIRFDEYRFGQSTSCGGPGCTRGPLDFYAASTQAIALDGKGFVVGDASYSAGSQVPAFGYRGDSEYAWSRPDDLVAQQSMKMAVPGYRLPDGAVASDYLLAHLDEPAPNGDVVVYPRGSDEAVDGNYHPVGFSLGPETYRDAGGQPVAGDGQDLSLLATRLRLDNGIDDPFDLQASPGVKYVIRNGGITGVFNVATGSLGAAAPQFYGYDLDLERFAVRTVDNVLDEFNWIDGRLRLAGDAGGSAGLDVYFTNLEVDCSATLGDVNLLFESCDATDNNDNGIIDENCRPSLSAWNSDFDLYAAGFKGNAAGEACAVQSQNFFLQHDSDFLALSDAVAFETQWSPAGSLVEQLGGELKRYRFDKSEEGDGFAFATSGASLQVATVDGERYGSLAFEQAKIAVPFWDAIDADIRVANRASFGGKEPAPTAVLRSGRLAELGTVSLDNRGLLQQENSLTEDDTNDAARIKASYTWGNTGFGFRLPVYYQPYQLDTGTADADAQGRQSRFLGRTLEEDLFVFDANAGINFIEPNRTKLSFGASADFTRLDGLEIQVDLSDPRTLARVDNTLEDFGIIRRPLLEPALSEFLNATDIVNRYAGRGMDELLQSSLEFSVEEIGRATAPLTPNGKDPFVTASEALTQLRSLPQQTMTVVTREFKQPLDAKLFSLEQSLRDELMQVNNRLLQLNSGTSAEQRKAIFAEVDGLIASLDVLSTDLIELDRSIGAGVDSIRSLRAQALDELAALVQATLDIEAVLQQAVSVADSACSGRRLSPSIEGNGYINDAAIRFAAVRQVADIVSGSNEIFSLLETLASDEGSRRRASTARGRIRDAAEELLGYLNTADAAVRQVLCQPGNTSAVLDGARAFTQRVQESAVQFSIVVNSASDPLELIDASDPALQADSLRGKLQALVIEPIAALREGLDVIRDENESLSGQELVNTIGCALYSATHPQDCTSSLSIPPAAGLFGINRLYADPQVQDERDIATVIFGNTRSQIDFVFSQVSTELGRWTEDSLPGAYMSPDQLRRVVVTEIMASQPVVDLRLAMDKHFGAIGDSLNDLVLQYTDQLNTIVQDALAAVTSPINDALNEAVASVRAIPLQAASVNGFATIAGNELERAHVSASWTMRGADDGDTTGFKAALDAERWSVTHGEDSSAPTACSVGANESLLDVKISAYGLPINVLASDIDIEKLYLGFTLKSGTGSGPALQPIGVFGGITTLGEIGFSEAIVFDPGFAAALGEKQTYIGASAGAVFSDIAADVAFLVGRVCPGNTVLIDLDPDVEKFLPALPPSGFTGAYLRGGATIPIIPGGCALNVGVSADFGNWLFVGQPTILGGLVGGGAVGNLACIASIRGKVTVAGSVSTDGDLKLTGDAFGVAGAGIDCDPGTWTSVRRSRDDSWCGTGDAQFDASFDNGTWQVTPPRVGAIY